MAAVEAETGAGAGTETAGLGFGTKTGVYKSDLLSKLAFESFNAAVTESNGLTKR